MAQDYSEIISWVYTNLGFPVVDVELDEVHIISAYKDAIQNLAKFAGLPNTFKEYSFRTSIGQSVYQLPSDCETVFQCTRESISGSIGDLGLGFADDLILIFNTQGRAFDLYKNGLSFYCSTSYLKFLGRTFGYEFTWEMWNNNSIKIYPMPKANLLVTLLYVPKVNLDDTAFTSSYQTNLFVKNWTLARAKMILGNIYQKYNGQIPGAAGGASSMISLRTDLAAEGKEEMDKLKEDINSWRLMPAMLVG